MWSLRWVLLGLGALLILGVYLWGRGILRRPAAGASARGTRLEPTTRDIDPDVLDGAASERWAEEPAEVPAAEAFESRAEGAPEADEADEAGAHSSAEADSSAGAEPPAAEVEAERVVTVRLVPKTDEPWNAQRIVLALRAEGLQHGRYGIFHRFPDAGSREEPLFSVANLTEPGSFDLAHLAETVLPGMSFFLVLPGAGDPVERFDMMVAAARSLALELDGELHDDRGSSWSIQRERYVREQIIEYRYQLERS